MSILRYRDALKTTLKASLMMFMQKKCQFSSIRNSRDAFSALDNALQDLEKHLKRRDLNLIKNLYEYESFALLFSSEDIWEEEIVGYFDTIICRKGAIAERDFFLKQFPNILKGILKDNPDLTESDIITKFDFSEIRKAAMEGPYIGFPDNTRYPDIAAIISRKENEITITVSPIKYSLSAKPETLIRINRETEIDGISSVIGAILKVQYENAESLPEVINAKIYLINTRHSLAGTNFVNFFQNDVITSLFRHSSRIDFPLLVYRGQYKPPKNQIREEIVVKHINKELWGINYDPVTSQKILDLIKDNSFIQGIYDDGPFKSSWGRYKEDDAKGWIKQYIRELAVSSQITDWDILAGDKKDRLTVTGIKRKSNLDYYLLTEKYAGSLGNLPAINDKKITTLFRRDGSGTLISTRDPTETINFPTRIIYNEKLGEYGLIIVSNNPNQKIGNPDSWSDGVFVTYKGKNTGKMFFNALFTGPSGRLLSSNFFDPYDGNGKFVSRSFNDLKKDFASSQYEHLHIEDLSNSKYGTRVFMVFSQVSNNYHVNTLVDLSLLNPYFAQNKDVHYEPSIMEDPIHPDLRQQLVWYSVSKEAKTVEPICVRENIEARTLTLAYAFSTLMRNIIDPIIPSSVIHQSDDLVITNDVFKIGSDGEIEYSLKYFREDVMNKLNPDPIQFKKINPVSITADGVSLEFNEEFTRKEFYRTYFELLWQHRNDPAFKEYFTSKWLGEDPELLSSGDTVLESDIMIMRKIDAVLERIYGYVGLTLIKFGVLKFRRIGDNNFEVRVTALPPNI